jgi:hypothetical protein
MRNVPRTWTEEQKQESRERMAAWRAGEAAKKNAPAEEPTPEPSELGQDAAVPHEGPPNGLLVELLRREIVSRADECARLRSIPGAVGVQGSVLRIEREIDVLNEACEILTAAGKKVA